MATTIQQLRGTAAQIAAYTGLDGVITVNRTTADIHVHDGSTVGGKGILARAQALVGLTVDSIAAFRSASVPPLVTTVQVQGYFGANTPGGGAFYRDDTDTTTIDDGGSCIVKGTVRWKRVYPQPIYTPEQFGAKGDSRRCPLFVTTAGSSQVTVAAGTGAVSDVGKTAVIPGGISGNLPFVATITAVSGNTYTLSAAPTVSLVSGAAQAGQIGSDDTLPLKAMVAAAPAGSRIEIKGRYLTKDRLETTKALSWLGLPGNHIVSTGASGLFVDRRTEGADAVYKSATYDGLAFHTCAKPAANLTAIELAGPGGDLGFFRNVVINCQGQGDIGTGWGNGIIGHSISNSYIARNGFKGLAVAGFMPSGYYGVLIENSQYVVVKDNEFTFYGEAVCTVSGANNAFVTATPTEAILVLNNHILSANIGVNLVATANGGTFFLVSGNHIDAFRRAVKANALNGALSMSQIIDNKIHMNKRSDESLIMRVAIEVVAPDFKIANNQILFYPQTDAAEKAYHKGILLGGNGSNAQIDGNAFLNAGGGIVDCSASPAPVFIRDNVNIGGSTAIIDPSSVSIRSGNYVAGEAPNFTAVTTSKFPVNGVPALVRNISGSSVAANGTVAGTGLALVRFSSAGVIGTGDSQQGIWKNVDGFAVAANEYALFVRVS